MNGDEWNNDNHNNIPDDSDANKEDKLDKECNQDTVEENAAGENVVEEDAAEAEALVDDLVTWDKEPKPVWKVDPKKRCHLHDNWLHAAMQAAMEDPTLTTILDLDNVEQLECAPLQNTLQLHQRAAHGNF